MSLRVTVTLLVLLVVTSTGVLDAGMPSTKVTLENGLKVILVENHSSPMIASIVFVNAGARYENEFNNGATHFLEHLLFDGTKTKTQEQLDDAIDRHGGYINAFTTKDLTAFLVLMPTQYIDFGLDVQSDQLFNSILPEDRFPKERKIVIEEIRQADDEPDYAVEKFNSEIVYAGTPYSRPVLGFENLINTVSREEILKHYQTYYAPNNMVALVMGDFNTAEFVKKYKQYFGMAAARPVPPVPAFKVTIPNEKRIVRQEFETKGCHLSFSSTAPLYSDPDYYAFHILNEMMNSEATSPLLKALTVGEGALAQSLSTSLTTEKDFTLFDIAIKTDSVKNIDKIIETVNQTIENTLAAWEPTQADIDAIVVSAKTQEVYLREKLHYYGFTIAPLMVSTGYDFIDNLTANLAKVKPADLKRVVAKYFKPFNYAATVVTPTQAGESSQTTQIKSIYLDRVLPNGLEVIIKSNPYSEVQAFMILGKDRAAAEPEGKEGITDFVNRMLVQGTERYPKDEISRRLTAIGANLTYTDNPYIPHDDIYTSRLYSFIKFETIKDFTDQGIDLLSELVRRPTFPESQVEQIRGEMMSVLGMKSGSTSQQARDVYFNLLFKGTTYTRPEMGSMPGIRSITAADLKDYHKRYYAPNNLILSVCTDADPQVMLQKLEKAFGDMPKMELTKSLVSAPATVVGEVSQNIPMEKKQTYLYLGNRACAASDSDVVPLRVLMDIFSKRLQDNLREKQGLAYRVGAGVTFDRNFGWFTAAMGTGVDNYAKAKAGMLHQMDSLRAVDVSSDELERAVNSLWGSLLTSRLSRINQAYYMAVNQFIIGKYDVEDDLISALKKVTQADVRRVAQKYFDTANYVLATVGAPKM
jgi:predicted Zn-dependent peptidase